MNKKREEYLKTKDKTAWLAMIQSMPASYNQKRTIKLNYEVLYSMYKDRHNHKLSEWRELCEVFKNLPHSEIFTLES